MEELNSQSGLDSWPVPVKVFEGAEKLVRLTGLPQRTQTKGMAWNSLEQPAVSRSAQRAGLARPSGVLRRGYFCWGWACALTASRTAERAQAGM